MPRRAPVTTACQRCRTKRAKCDGQQPCHGCEKAGQVCEYDHARRELKGELRAEIELFKKTREESDRILQLINAIEDPVACKAALRELMGSTESPKSVLQRLPQDTAFDWSSPTKSSPGKNGSHHGAFAQDSMAMEVDSAVEAACFDHILSWKSCGRNIRRHDAPVATLGSIPVPSTILSLPPLPLDAYTLESRRDTWTQIGWTRAHIRHLFDSLVTWDYLPFSFLCTDLFLQDYQSCTPRFCSSALVHAILALATRLINESNDDTDVLPTGWFGSEMFFGKAWASVQDCGGPQSLPDIQALGLLSLYQLRRGREAKALELAQAFADRIADFYQQRPVAGEDEDSARARTTTYRGAISLKRMLRITTGKIFNAPSLSPPKDALVFDLPAGSTRGVGLKAQRSDPDLVADTNLSQPRNLQLISIKIFEITEWVHKLVTSSQSVTDPASIDLTSFYHKCLEWYETVFGLLNIEGGRTPFVLFVHMYYHFCILCAFRPFINLGLEDAYMQPLNLCAQAAQSILALAQSYDDLFTLRRVSGLVPYFVCASGLFSLSMLESGLDTEHVHLRLGDGVPPMIKAEPEQYESLLNHNDSSTIPSHARISTAAHARLLLSKMSSTHPAAMVAKGLLDRDQD